MIWVRVEATEEEIALITQAARKLGLTPSQFVTRAAASLRSKQKSQGSRSRPLIARKDGAATSETEVLIDIDCRIGYNRKS